jgi:hypothetical protein
MACSVLDAACAGQEKLVVHLFCAKPPGEGLRFARRTLAGALAARLRDGQPVGTSRPAATGVTAVGNGEVVRLSMDSKVSGAKRAGGGLAVEAHERRAAAATKSAANGIERASAKAPNV